MQNVENSRHFFRQARTQLTRLKQIHEDDYDYEKEKPDTVTL